MDTRGEHTRRRAQRRGLMELVAPGFDAITLEVRVAGAAVLTRTFSTLLDADAFFRNNTVDPGAIVSSQTQRWYCVAASPVFPNRAP